MTAANHSPEYLSYKNSEIWTPLTKVASPSFLFDNNKLLNYLYKKIKYEYKRFPLRKDGTDPFIHPLNIVYYLIKAGVDDPITLAAGLLHDYIEENVDLFKEQQKIGDDHKSYKILAKKELEYLSALHEEIKEFCLKENINPAVAKKICDVIYILTREKSHIYYRSISDIFHSKNEKTKERAIQVKLSDRIHNIQTLSSYDEKGQIYQCFKNLFILNNAKRYLMEYKGSKKRRNIYSTNKLFIKCCKSTYESFLNVCHSSKMHKISNIKSMLHLSFRKYVSEYGGLWAVTKVNRDERHLVRLFQGIIRKYDARLHMNHKKFDKMENFEIEFCKKYFNDFNFNQAQIRSLIHYKDAYALKEVIARLLYKKNYVIFRFGCSDLCLKGRP